MTEGQTFGHAGSCDKAENCRSDMAWHQTAAFAYDIHPRTVQKTRH
jgi:hypothetical protein